MEQPLQIAAIVASLRNGTFNGWLADSLPELAPDGMVFQRLTGLAEFPPYDFDQQAVGFPSVVRDWADATTAADGVMIISPEYNYSVPGVLKNALDWLSRLRPGPLLQKPVALQSAATGMLGGARMQYHLRQVLLCLDARVMNGPEVFATEAARRFDGAVRLTDADTRRFVGEQLSEFRRFITG